MHVALLGIIILIGLIVVAVARIRHKRETAQARTLDQPNESAQHESEPPP